METKKEMGIKAKIQRLGSYLSGMVMPNIGAFIAWGVITALFIPTGYFPNESLAEFVGPMLTYLLPVLIGYTGGHMIYGQRGAVVGSIATFGVIIGSDVPMFIGAMMMGPLGGWVIKKFDDMFQDKIKAGFEMLVNNFSSGLLGFALAILGFFGIGPVVTSLTNFMATGVETIINAHLLPFANVFIEPAKILFLNNAINHGILTPLGAEQVAETGKSILFLLEANPGPGLGVLLAFMFFGKGSAKSSAPGAIIIQFLGGIHEIYFPYVMMKPALFLAVIAGGVSGTFMFQLTGASLQAAASPGSIVAIMAMAPKGGHLSVLLGVLVATVVSFLVSMVILKADKSVSDSDDFDAKKQEVQESKAESKGQVVENKATMTDVQKIIFACDAGMGSSAMGASILRDKVKKSGINVDVVNSSINNLKNEPGLLIVTQEELQDRVAQKLPGVNIITVSNFLNSPKYDLIVRQLGDNKSEELSKVTPIQSARTETDLSGVTEIIFACDAGMGSSAMGASLLRKQVINNGLEMTVMNKAINQLEDKEHLVVITQEELTERAKQKAPKAYHLSVDNFLESPKYQELIDNLIKNK